MSITSFNRSAPLPAVPLRNRMQGGRVLTGTGVTGQFFDGLSTARALPQAYDRQFRTQLREVTDRMLSQPAGRPVGREPDDRLL